MWLQFRANLAGRYIETRMRRVHLSLRTEGIEEFSKWIRRCSVNGWKRYENDKCGRKSFSEALLELVLRPKSAQNRSRQLRNSKEKYNFFVLFVVPGVAVVTRKFTKPTQRQRERHWAKELTSSTMTVHVSYNYWYISSPFSAKQDQIFRCLDWEREPHRLIFYIFVLNLSLCFGFSFITVLNVINKVNDFRVPRDS